jgi:hypothetical protein
MRANPAAEGGPQEASPKKLRGARASALAGAAKVNAIATTTSHATRDPSLDRIEPSVPV